ncbi:MAG: fumarate hydratase C-terminal domain-containing protein [Chloroflexi bacterium]|nr:fumarate hydratase C-terminal domain-containing protein [Chloroflexota bacterium]
MSIVRIEAPLSDAAVAGLHAGDEVEINGNVYVARDAAHKRFAVALDAGEPLPFDLRGQILYYMGPTPAPEGRPIGSAGPTTAGRIDGYTPRLLSLGLKGMIGKGNRSAAVRAAICEHRAVYFVAIGGAGALLSQFIEASEVVAYDELGAEAVRRLRVSRFPAIVGNDMHGGDLFEIGKQRYRTAV